MSCEIKHLDGNVHIWPSENGRNRIIVSLCDKTRFSPCLEWETQYPIDLVKKILEVKGPAYLCNEIMRDEQPSNVENELKNDLFCYCARNEFLGKRILDFGCGAGASSVIMSRLLPESRIVGIDLDPRLLDIANARREYYRSNNIEFLLSPSPEQLPDDIGTFDFVVLSAVYEHLLPIERKKVIAQIWDLLTTNGVLFIDQTPYRYWPIENHTTSLPLINYLPDTLAFFMARNLSRRISPDMTWEDLLRAGIRGGSLYEILGELRKIGRGRPVLLEPTCLNGKGLIELWYTNSCQKRFNRAKLWTMHVLKMIRAISGMSFTPTLALAIRKGKVTG